MNRQTKKEIRRLAVKILVAVLALGLAFWGYAFVYRGKTEPPAKYPVTNQDAAVYSLRGQIQMLSQQEELNTFAFEGRKKEKERRGGKREMTIFSYILVAFLIVCAVAVCLNKNLLTSIVIFMSYSVIMCIIWILLESPDLAITEAAVGAGVTSLLFFMTLKKIHALTEVRGEEEPMWDDEEGEDE